VWNDENMSKDTFDWRAWNTGSISLLDKIKTLIIKIIIYLGFFPYNDDSKQEDRSECECLPENIVGAQVRGERLGAGLCLDACASEALFPEKKNANGSTGFWKMTEFHQRVVVICIVIKGPAIIAKPPHIFRGTIIRISMSE